MPQLLRYGAVHHRMQSDLCIERMMEIMPTIRIGTTMIRVSALELSSLMGQIGKIEDSCWITGFKSWWIPHWRWIEPSLFGRLEYHNAMNVACPCLTLMKTSFLGIMPSNRNATGDSKLLHLLFPGFCQFLGCDIKPISISMDDIVNFGTELQGNFSSCTRLGFQHRIAGCSNWRMPEK